MNGYTSVQIPVCSQANTLKPILSFSIIAPSAPAPAPIPSFTPSAQFTISNGTYKSVDLNAPFFFIYIFGNTITFYRVLEIVELLWRNFQHSFHAVYLHFFFAPFYLFPFRTPFFLVVVFGALGACIVDVLLFIFNLHQFYVCLSLSLVRQCLCHCLCGCLWEHMTSNSFI